MKKKELLIIICSVLLFILATILILFIKNKRTAISQQKRERTTSLQKEKTTQLTAFPLISLEPTSKRNTLLIKLTNNPQLWQSYTKLNYELMYNSDRGPRGLMGSLTSQSLSEELFLGSESSGHRVYDKGIDNGQLTLYLENQKGENINLGTHYFIVGGYKYTNKWVIDSFELSTKKKNRSDFVLLVLNNSQSSTAKPAKYIISVRPLKFPLTATFTLKNIININQVKLGDKEIKYQFDSLNHQLSFTIDRGGEYYLN